jgi:hypothetical protein
MIYTLFADLSFFLSILLYVSWEFFFSASFCLPSATVMASSATPFELNPPTGVRNFWRLGLIHSRKKLESFLTDTLVPEACIDDDAKRDELRLACDKIEADKDPRYNSSLLLHVVSSGMDPWKFVSRLLALGLDPNTADKSNQSAAHLALKQANYECAKCLLLCRPWRDVGSADAKAFFSQVTKKVKVCSLSLVVLRLTQLTKAITVPYF